MRNLCLLLGLLLLPVLLRGEDGGITLKREAGKCAAAWQRSDYEKIVAHLPARVIQQWGGRAAVLQQTKDQFAQARSLGVQRMEAMVGKIPAPKRAGSWMSTVIPVTALLHGSHLDLTQQTHVLGVSPDLGKHWYFVLLYQVTQAELNAWFPEFAGKVIVPTDPPPQVEFVY
jgi:hypothetical protein